VVFLGRMHPDKGAHRAVQAARLAGVPIRLAAKMWEPLERCYFEEQVEPLLGSDAVYLGEVAGAEKRTLLAGARALLNPIRWREPFGLVMVEALSCGTPVISFAEGSAPEIVRHGVNGFLVDDEADMAAAIAKIGTIDRAICRRDAVERFDARRMVLEYEQLFRRVVAGNFDIFAGLAPDADYAGVHVEAIGCSKASASDIRRGKRTPHVSTWPALAELANHSLGTATTRQD
jgi:glycosyltransferase involved in cell wall biosynthesis